MIKKLLSAVLIIFYTASLQAYYPSSDSGGYPGEILLSLGGGPRGMATGGAFSTVDESNVAPYWNPAGLAGIGAHEISLHYVPLWMNGEYGAFNFAHPLPPGFELTQDSTLGIGYYRLRSGLAEETDVLGRSLGDFSDKWDTFNFTYARKLSKNVNWGVNYKLINRNYYNYASRLHGLDTGIQGKVKLPGEDTLKFSFTVQNLMFTKLEHRSEEKIPPNLKFGMGYQTPDGKRTLMLDVDQVIDDTPHNPRFYLGGETEIFDLLNLRAGFNYKQAAVGMGMHLFNMDIDYAYIFHELGNTHRMSVNFRFGKRNERETKLIQKTKQKANTRIETLKNVNQAYINLITKAIKLFQEGNYKEASREFEKILERDPLDKDTAQAIQSILVEIDQIVAQKKLEKAEEHYKEAKRLFERNAFDKVEEELDKALDLNPDLKKAEVFKLRNTGFKHISAGRLQEGVNSLEKALELDPDNKRIRKNVEKLKEYIEAE
ncbi:MAG: PorV/PorQ family protein [Elusimicrobiota bacterium]